MPLYFPDRTKAISGEFFISESRLKTNSRKAYRKIVSWKKSFATTDEAETHYRQQFDNLVANSFFNNVSNVYVLMEEKFHERPTEN